MFCGEKRVDFTGNNLEPHYLTECPMLAQCTHCSQVCYRNGWALKGMLGRGVSCVGVTPISVLH